MPKFIYNQIRTIRFGEICTNDIIRFNLTNFGTVQLNFQWIYSTQYEYNNIVVEESFVTPSLTLWIEILIQTSTLNNIYNSVKIDTHYLNFQSFRHGTHNFNNLVWPLRCGLWFKHHYWTQYLETRVFQKGGREGPFHIKFFK